MLLAALDTFSLVASGAFMFGGIVMVIGALKNSLLQTRHAAQEHLRRKEAVTEFWRTMDAAADRLEVVIAEIQGKADNRRNVLDRLSREAHQQIRRLEKLVEEIDAEHVKERRTKRARQVRPSLAAASAVLAEELRREAGPAPEPSVTDAQGDAPADLPFERTGYRQVVQANAAGRSIEDICRETEMPKGEVELILTLSSRMRVPQRDSQAPSASAGELSATAVAEAPDKVESLKEETSTAPERELEA